MSRYIFQGYDQKFEKGGAQFPVSVSTENIGEDQKKGLHVFRWPIYPTKFRWLEIYIRTLIRTANNFFEMLHCFSSRETAFLKASLYFESS